MTFVQRFGGALNLNVHFHCIVPDGVFVREGGTLRFATLRPPTDGEVQAVLLRIARRLDRLLRPHRPGPDTELSSLDIGYAESLQASLPGGLTESPRRKRQSALVDGFSLHAGVHLHANDREGIPWAELLERVFRIDVLRCERCGGRMTVLAFLTGHASVKKVLEHLGLPTTGPPIAKARSPVEFDFAF